MNVINYLVYRVVPIEKAKGIHIGDVIPIPVKREDFDGGTIKKETEDLFEIVRENDYPESFSRKSCLFVLPYDEEILVGWLSDHHAHDDFDYALLTLRLNGSIMWCDEDIFTRAGLIPSFRNQLSKEYWEKASNNYMDFQTPEGLFRGEAIIVDYTFRHYIAPNCQ